ncbi:MAG: hypothetical protein HOU81_23190 [Hamadaea sp.]|uniref:hypothetical protein n=1 Tax=Hamadaea sp. TaxID=2024425 RepID=UPI00179C615B|nr:hypothetical protein [Hamadaea sp.]NUR73731.1 hypothetical protein [Hamadaea sp.]NUT19582.1 hypothetical protein [Hamadaea sp.]
MEGFTDAEWGLLVGLPQAVLLAASAAEEDSTRRTAAEHAAGMAAIADARQSASPLVQAVATEIVARLGDPDGDDLGVEEASLPVFAPGDPAAVAADALDRAKAAAQLLDERGHEADAAAYKHWLVTVADEVVTAASSGGVLGIGGTEVSAAEQTFRDELVQVLND